MFSADQFVAHLVGDYIIQNDWMAQEKVRRSSAALVHAVTYALPFLFLTTDFRALAFIAGTHFVIDRFRLARYVIWVRNLLAPANFRNPWVTCAKTGFHTSRPDWLAVWLLIITDNTLHILLNGVALQLWP